MLRTRTSLLGMLMVASLGMGCGGDDDGDDSDGQDDGADDGGTVQDPTDPALYTTPDGEDLAFGVQEGDLRNYFRRKGPAAVHLLTRSGADARIVAAFPANNQGIGIWFLWRTTQFARDAGRLAKELEAEGGLPVDELKRTPSGRIDRASADEVFAKAEAHARKEHNMTIITPSVMSQIEAAIKDR